MSRRQLNQYQKRRINRTQLTHSVAVGTQVEGLVIAHHGEKIVVEIAWQKRTRCTIKSNLGSIVCGDRVTLEQTSQDNFRVLGVIPRQNLLQRLDGFGQQKSVAANINQLVVCLAIKPEPNLFLLDQYLLCAAHQNIKAIILFNKIDLLDQTDTDPFSLKEIYRKIGYQILFISAQTGQGLNQLHILLAHNTSILNGASGVGKSSIIAALLPHRNIKTAKISDTSEEGRHTTRTSYLYHLPNNGQLIDTPGVRGFNPQLDSKKNLSSGFTEISDYGNKCRFANCKHHHEPNCAVIEAVKNGDIVASRYQHYLRLLTI